LLVPEDKAGLFTFAREIGAGNIGFVVFVSVSGAIFLEIGFIPLTIWFQPEVHALNNTTVIIEN